MKLPLAILGPVLALAFGAPALAVESSMQIVLELTGNAQRDVITYQCDGLEPFTVEYVNAAPTFLAFVPIEGEKHLFVNVISASGVKYVSGQYAWWTKGSSADLHDETAGEDAEPISCIEATEIP